MTRIVEFFVLINAIGGVLTFLGLRAVVRKMRTGFWKKIPREPYPDELEKKPDELVR
jgi:hypothetical protein